MAPSYLKELINKKPEGLYHLRNQEQLIVPRTRCKTFGDRAFSKSGPTLWNSLPESIKKITNLEKFKKELKTFLFKQAYNLH